MNQATTGPDRGRGEGERAEGARDRSPFDKLRANGSKPRSQSDHEAADTAARAKERGEGEITPGGHPSTSQHPIELSLNRY